MVLIVDFGFNLSATKRIAQANDDVDKCNEVFWNVVAAKSLLLVVSSVILLVLMLTVPTFQLYSQAIWATWPWVRLSRLCGSFRERDIYVSFL